MVSDPYSQRPQGRKAARQMVSDPVSLRVSQPSEPEPQRRRDLLLLGITALLGTAGQLLNTHAYRHGRAVAMAVTGLSEVVFTLLLAWTIAGDALPPWTTFLGGGAILAAAWIATRPRGLPDAAA